MYNATKHVYDLLENLLQWSRIKNNRIDFNPVSFFIDEMINNVAQIFHENAFKKSINIKLNIEEKVSVWADKNMLESTLRNLFSNAIKFTDNNGEISVDLKSNNQFLEIAISDTGIGLSKDEIENLFILDKSQSKVGTNSEQGTGLGLILCKEFVEKNSGQLFVKSELGTGSTFTIRLPQKAQD